LHCIADELLLLIRRTASKHKHNTRTQLVKSRAAKQLPKDLINKVEVGAWFMFAGFFIGIY
jgi:hypothetical protein